MHAAVLPEKPLYPLLLHNLLEPDEGPGVGLEVGRVLIRAGGGCLPRGKLVPLLAGELAAAAAGALRNVDEFHFLGHVISPPS